MPFKIILLEEDLYKQKDLENTIKSAGHYVTSSFRFEEAYDCLQQYDFTPKIGVFSLSSIPSAIVAEKISAITSRQDIVCLVLLVSFESNLSQLFPIGANEKIKTIYVEDVYITPQINLLLRELESCHF